MPSSITHELIARETLELLTPRMRELIFAAPDYYYLGAQGPDLFFFYRPLSGDNWGKRLHRAGVYEWFSALLKAVPHYTGEDFSECFAYALGFCTHLAADVTFHPFIYRYLEKTDAPRFTHQEIENDWDVYFLRELDGKSVISYPLAFDLKTIAGDGTLLCYLTEAAALTGKTLSAEAFRAMCRRFDLYLRHFHAPHGKIFKVFGLSKLYPREEPDPAYLRGKNYFALTGNRASTADGLFRLATEESALRINCFFETFNSDMPLPHSLFSQNLLTGKVI